MLPDIYGLFCYLIDPQKKDPEKVQVYAFDENMPVTKMTFESGKVAYVLKSSEHFRLLHLEKGDYALVGEGFQDIYVSEASPGDITAKYFGNVIFWFNCSRESIPIITLFIKSLSNAKHKHKQFIGMA